jgi:acetyl-CoA carboxylase biotin carboxyl carrier protein
MDIQELKELIKVFEDSDLNEFELEEEGRKLRMQKNGPETVTTQMPMMYPQSTPMLTQSPVSVEMSGAQSQAAAPEEEVPVKTIDSPMVGTFYTSSSPGEPVFVQVGDSIEEGQTICIVEAMKLMNEVTAKSNCVIEKILVENGDPVEFGQPLFVIR